MKRRFPRLGATSLAAVRKQSRGGRHAVWPCAEMSLGPPPVDSSGVHDADQAPRGLIWKHSGPADMSMPGDDSREAALRMVGRTLVNFQRLEHNLKRAARLGPLQGTIQAVQRDMSRRQDRASTLTLGQAIQAWLDFLYGQPAAHGGTADLFDVTFRTTFALEFDAEAQARDARALRDLLDVRNDFIHSRFATFDWDAPEACEGLIADLERVNAAIAGQIRNTDALLTAIAALYKEHAERLAAIVGSGAGADDP